MKRLLMIAALSAAALFMGACATNSNCGGSGKECCAEKTSCCGTCGGAAHKQ